MILDLDGTKFAVVTGAAGVKQVLAKLRVDGRTHGLDFETTGLRPEDALVRITAISGPAGNWVIDHWKAGVPFAQVADELAEICDWYVFNAGFEGRWFDYYTARTKVGLLDVGLMHKAKYGGGWPHSLAQLVKKVLHKERDNKSLQVSNWAQPDLTPEQYCYAFEDALDTYQIGDLYAQGLTDAQYDGFLVLNDSWRGTAEMEDTGMCLDVPYHKTLIAMWERRRATAERVLRHYTPESVLPNLRSKKQISDFLKTTLEPRASAAWAQTATGQLQTTRKTLTQASFRAPYPFSRWLAALIVFNRADKYLSTYGETLITKAELHPDRRIHGRLNIAQAITGRYSSCIPAYVPVTRGDGTTMPMADVRPGNFVLTHKMRAQKVVKNIYSGVANVYRIYLETGEVLDCTSNHRLLTNQGWQSLEDYYGLAFDTQPKNRGDVFIPGKADDETGVRGFWRQPESRHHGYSEGATAGAEEAREGSTLLQEQRRLQKSYEGEIRRVAPQLRRGGTRPQGLSYGDYARVDGAGTATGVSAPRGHVQGTWLVEDTGRVSCPPHQRRHDGQPTRQLSPSIRRWARSDTSTYAKIRRLEFVGVAPVFDLEVSTDHSFIAGGVFVHNSNPNLQNIPRSKVVRRSFVAPEGAIVVVADYSGVELRVLAEMSGDAQLKKDVIYGNVHAESAITLYDLARQREDFMESLKNPAHPYHGANTEKRSKAKAFSFQLTYGAGTGALAVVLRCSDDEAREFVAKWAERYPAAYNFRYRMFDIMNSTGFLHCQSGRSIFVHRNERSIPVASNYPIQGSAGDVMYRAIARMHDAAEVSRFPISLLNTVHDELLLLTLPEYEEQVKALLESEMKKAWLDIFPGTSTDNLVEAGAGPSWASAK